jgi:hypothetical protein
MGVKVSRDIDSAYTITFISCHAHPPIQRP